VAQALADLALERLAERAALEVAQGQAQAVDQWVPARGATQAMEHLAAKALTLAQNRAAESSNEDLGQAQPGVEDHAEEVPAAWARAALAAGARRAARADRAIQEAACRPGLPKMKTSWEF
jgi:hypothetical protein